MPSGFQVADEYLQILTLWRHDIIPDLAGSTQNAAQEWRDLTFTNIFDRFCHFIIHEVKNSINLPRRFPELQLGDRQERIDQFDDFIGRYLLIPADAFRVSQFDFATDLAAGQNMTINRVRDFLLQLNSVQGADHRYTRKVIQTIRNSPLQTFMPTINLLADEDIPIYDRIQRALDFQGIPNFGPSRICEIPGWLRIPNGQNTYPIVNGKFIDTLRHMGWYTRNFQSCFD